jgi:carbon storage regulator
MLILARKEGESLVIAGDTVIRILEIRGMCIRLGIEAPEDVLVVRSELIGEARRRESAHLDRSAD